MIKRLLIDLEITTTQFVCLEYELII